MGQEYLIDTNTTIDYFGLLLPAKTVKLISTIKSQSSVVTRIKLLASTYLTVEESLKFTEFINSSVVHPLTEAVIQQTIYIRKNFRVKLPDSIIAATALTHNITLLTRNTADFKKILGLNVVDPHSM